MARWSNDLQANCYKNTTVYTLLVMALFVPHEEDLASRTPRTYSSSTSVVVVSSSTTLTTTNQ